MSYRDRLDVEALLTALDIKFTRQGVKLRAICPNPEHKDSDPSWAIIDNPGSDKHGGHWCFSCKHGGGPWELVRAVRGMDEEQAALFVHALITGAPRPFPGVPRVKVRTDRSADEYRLPPEVRIPSLDGSEWPDVFADYIASRGVTEDQLVRWRIGYATRGPLAWRIVIPVHTRGRLVAHVGRAVFDDRERYDMPFKKHGARPSLAVFGEPLVDPARRVLTIAEGSFSMLALERAGAPNPVALLGSDWSAGKAAILSSVPWDLIVIATDPDAAGDRVARDIAASYRKSTIRRLRMDRSPDDCGLDDLQAAVRTALAA